MIGRSQSVARLGFERRLLRLEAKIHDRAPEKALVMIVAESGLSGAQRSAAKVARKGGIDVIECFVVDSGSPELEFPHVPGAR